MNNNFLFKFQSAIAYRPWLMAVFALSAILAAAFMIYSPLMDAGFYSDDWTFLALSRHGDGPLGFFVYDHSFTYMYRPVAMGTWWLMTQVSGVEAAGHYFFATILHVLTCLVMMATLYVLSVRLWLVLALGVLLVVHPTSVITVSWLADRFDLMMSLGVSLGLLATSLLPRKPRLSLLLMLLSVLIALCSKESGLALMPLLAIGIWFSGHARSYRVRLIAVFVSLGLLYFVVRYLVLGSLGGIAVKAGGYSFLWYGTLYWMQNLPLALAGHGLPSLFGGVFLLLILSLAGFVLCRASKPTAVTVFQLLVLIVLLAVLQSPVTQVILQQEQPFRSVVNFRFFYLAIMALLVMFVLGVNYFLDFVGRRKIKRIAPLFFPVFFLLLLAFWGSVARDEAQAWAKWTGAVEREQLLGSMVNLVNELETNAGRGRSGPCLVRLLGASERHTDLGGYSDLMIKAHIPRESRLVNCIFATEREPWKAITTWQEYEQATVGLVPAQRSWTLRSGRLAVHVKTNDDAHQWSWQKLHWIDGRFQ